MVCVFFRTVFVVVNHSTNDDEDQYLELIEFNQEK